MRVSLVVQRLIAPGLALLAVLLLGACAMDTLSNAFTKTPEIPSLDLTPYSRATVSVPPSAKRITLTPADFVNADGTCAPPSPDSATAQATAVALEMTECGLVQVLGPPEKLDIGANERGDRTAVMVFNRGERPGIYNFTGGQLTSMQRVAEPPPPPKPQKPTKPAKKPARAADNLTVDQAIAAS